MKYLYLAFGLALAVSSCSKDNIDSQNPPQPQVPVTQLDVSYGEDPQQKMDIYLPEIRNSKTRMLIIIHGGGWSGGDKTDYNSFITEFQNRVPGYALANLNYRLVKRTGNYFPTQENDINSAITFLKNKTTEYNISQNFIYLGVSAGAHLAMLQGYKHSDVLQPRGIISFFGPVDLQRLYINSDSTIPVVLRNIMNATLESDPNIFAESSPINYVNGNSAPTLLLHGDEDHLVPLEQAYMLRDKLQQSGVYNKLVVYPGKAHGWGGEELEDSFSQVVSFMNGLEN